MIDYTLVPERSAFRTRRLIAAVRRSAGVAKAYREDRNSGFVVKSRTVQIHPIPQAVATCVVPGNPGPMDLAAWRLADDQ
jgi:hypothetical protein